MTRVFLKGHRLMADTLDDLHRPYLPIAKFGKAIYSSKGKVWQLLNAGKITAVKSGRTTLIEQTPAEYLDALPPYRPGAMAAGPGRGKRGPMTRVVSGGSDSARS